MPKETKYDKIQKAKEYQRINEGLVPEVHLSINITSIDVSFYSLVHDQLILQLFCDSAILDVNEIIYKPESISILAQISTISLSQSTLSTYVTPNYLPIKNYILYLTNLDIEYNVIRPFHTLIHNNNIYFQWTPEAFESITDAIELLLSFMPLDYIPKPKDYEKIEIPSMDQTPSDIPPPLFSPYTIFNDCDFSCQIVSDTIIAYIPINLFEGTAGTVQGDLQWLNITKDSSGFQCHSHHSETPSGTTPKNQYECFELITKLQVGFINREIPEVLLSESTPMKSNGLTSEKNSESQTNSNVSSHDSIAKQKEWALQLYDTYIRFYNPANYNDMNQHNFIPIFTYVNPIRSSTYFCDVTDINVVNTLVFDPIQDSDSFLPLQSSDAEDHTNQQQEGFDSYHDTKNIFPRNTFKEEEHSTEQWKALHSKYKNTANVYYNTNYKQLLKKHFYKSIPSYNPYLKISETTQDTVLFLSNFVVTSADTNTDSITDLYFSSCYAFLTPYRFFNIWRVASEISFSVWCVLYDIQNSMENVLPVLYKISPFGEEIVWNVSCREMNDHYPHVTASNGYTRPPPSKRNPLYTSKHYIKYLLWLKKNANSSSGDSIIRLSIDNVNVSAYIGDVPIEVSVGVMGSETLPSISFFFRDVSIQLPPYLNVYISEFTLSECWYSYDIQSFALLGMLQKEIIERYKALDPNVESCKSLMRIQITDVTLSVLTFQDIDKYIDYLMSTISSFLTVFSSLPCSFSPSFAHFYNYFFWEPPHELTAHTQIIVHNVTLQVVDSIYEMKMQNVSAKRNMISERLYQYQIEKECMDDYNEFYPSTFSASETTPLQAAHSNPQENYRLSNGYGSQETYSAFDDTLHHSNEETETDKFTQFKENEIYHYIQNKQEQSTIQSYLLRLTVESVSVLIADPPTKTYDFWKNIMDWSVDPIPSITPPDSQLLSLTIRTAYLYLRNPMKPLVFAEEVTVKGEMLSIDPPYNELFYQCSHTYYNEIPIHVHKSPIIPVMFGSFNIKLHSTTVNVLPSFLSDLNQLQLQILDPISSYLHIGNLPLQDQFSMLLRGDIVFSADKTTLNILSDVSSSTTIPKPQLLLSINRIVLQSQTPYLSFSISSIQCSIKEFISLYDTSTSRARLNESPQYSSSKQLSNLFTTKTYVILTLDEFLGTVNAYTKPDIRRKLFFLPLEKDPIDPTLFENESKCSITRGYIRTSEAQHTLESTYLQAFISKSTKTEMNIVISGSPAIPLLSISPSMMPHLVSFIDIWMNELTLRPFTLSSKLPPFSSVTSKDLSLILTLKNIDLEVFIDKQPDLLMNKNVKLNSNQEHSLLSTINQSLKLTSSLNKTNQSNSVLFYPSLHIQIPTIYGVIECCTNEPSPSNDSIQSTNEEMSIVPPLEPILSAQSMEDHKEEKNDSTSADPIDPSTNPRSLIHSSLYVINKSVFSVPKTTTESSSSLLKEQTKQESDSVNNQTLLPSQMKQNISSVSILSFESENEPANTSQDCSMSTNEIETNIMVKTFRFEVNDIDLYIIPHFALIEEEDGDIDKYKNNLLNLHYINLFYADNNELMMNQNQDLAEPSFLSDRSILSDSFKSDTSISEHMNISIPLSSTNYFINHSKLFAKNNELPQNSFFKFVQRDEDGNVKEDQTNDEDYQAQFNDALSVISSDDSISDMNEETSTNVNYYEDNQEDIIPLTPNNESPTDQASEHHSTSPKEPPHRSFHMVVKRRKPVVRYSNAPVGNIKNSLSEYTRSTSSVPLSLLRSSIGNPYLLNAQSKESLNADEETTLYEEENELCSPKQPSHPDQDQSAQRTTTEDSSEKNSKKQEEKTQSNPIPFHTSDEYSYYENGFMYCSRIDSITGYIYPSSIEFILELYDDFESYYSKSILLRVFYHKHIKNSSHQKMDLLKQEENPSLLSPSINDPKSKPILIPTLSTLDRYANRKLLKELDPELRNRQEISSSNHTQPPKEELTKNKEKVSTEQPDSIPNPKKNENESNTYKKSIYTSLYRVNRNVFALPNQNPTTTLSKSKEAESTTNSSTIKKDVSILQQLFILQIHSLKMKIYCETSHSDLALYIPWTRLRIFTAPIYELFKMKASIDHFAVLHSMNNTQDEWFDEPSLIRTLSFYKDLHDDLQPLPPIPLVSVAKSIPGTYNRSKIVYHAFYNILFCTHPIKCFYHQINNNCISNTVRIETLKMNGYLTMETVPSIVLMVDEYSAKLQSDSPYGEGNLVDVSSSMDEFSLYEQYKSIIRKQNRLCWLLYHYSMNPSLMNKNTIPNLSFSEYQQNPLTTSSTVLNESNSLNPKNGMIPIMIPTIFPNSALYNTNEPNRTSLLSYIYPNVSSLYSQPENALPIAMVPVDPSSLSTSPQQPLISYIPVPLSSCPPKDWNIQPSLTLMKLLELSKIYCDTERTLRCLMQKVEVKESETEEKHYPNLDISLYLDRIRCQFFENNVLHHDIRLDHLDGEVVLFNYKEGEFQLHLHSLAVYSFLEEVTDPRILMPFLLEHQKQTSPLLIVNCEIIPPDHNLFTIRSFVVSVHPLRVQISKVAIQNLMNYFDTHGIHDNHISTHDSSFSIPGNNVIMNEENSTKKSSKAHAENDHNSTQPTQKGNSSSMTANKKEKGLHFGKKVQIKYLRINRINVFCSITSGSRPVPGIEDFSMIKLKFKPQVFNSKIDYPLSIAYGIGKSFLYDLLSQTGRTVTGVLTVMANSLGFSSLVSLLRAPAPVPKSKKEPFYSHYSSLLSNANANNHTTEEPSEKQANASEPTHDSTLYFYSEEDINDRCNLLLNMEKDPIDFVSTYRYSEIMRSIEDFQNPYDKGDCKHKCYDETYTNCVSNPLTAEEYKSIQS